GYRYRLRLGHFPLISFTAPTGGMRGAKTTFAVEGPGCDHFHDNWMVLRAGGAGVSRTWLNLRYSHGEGSGFAPFLCGDLPEIVERRPNSTPALANSVSLPVAITGRFDTPGQPAYFEFKAKAGDPLSIRGLTRSIGSPATLL